MKYTGFLRLVVWLLCLTLAYPASADIVSLAVKDKVREQFGAAGVARLERWEAMVWANEYQSTMVKLKAVNDFFNKMQFETDMQHWHQQDYWATPFETIGSNGGDCEDFAIAKYYTLRQLGIPSSKMRITYVKALKLNQPHMVLTYYPDDGNPLVLDILIPQMLPASERTDLVPVYSFNAEGLWEARTHGKDLRLGSATDISMWRHMIARMGVGQL